MEKLEIFKEALRNTQAYKLSQIEVVTNVDGLAIYSLSTDGVRQNCYFATELCAIAEVLGCETYAKVDNDHCAFLRVF